MKVKNLLITAVMCSMTCACVTKTAQQSGNPFFTAFENNNGAPPFDQIKFEHYEPALNQGIEEQKKEIEAIANNQEVATFENTIVALDNSGEMLRRTQLVFESIKEAESNDSIKALAKRIAPRLAAQSDNIYLNESLYKRVAQVERDVKENPNKYTTEQKELVSKYYKDFVRSGAALNSAQKETLRKINQELSTLGLEYSAHIQNDNNAYQLVISDKKDLAGIPEWLRESASSEAEANGLQGKWLFTLDTPSRLPFLQYAANRQLRKELYTAYINKGNHDDENDNKKIITRILTLRLQKAHLLGFDTYADFVLDNNMAKNSKTVMDFLYKVFKPALAKSKQERKEMQAIMDKEGKGQKLAAWDWWYYTEKLRQEKYNFNEDELKPYFKLENVREGAFMVANKLFGITFTPIKNVPIYHKDVEVFEVKDAQGKHLSLFYTDYFPRQSKRGGAWMSIFREAKKGQRPVVYNVGNFTKPTGDTPSLLTLDEVETTFHEFGHALHGMLTRCNYYGVAGTNVSRDFVELPSQIMENWATDPVVLKMYAKHYKTGEIIPQRLIDKIQELSTFNQGFMTTELAAASILDMELHSLKNTDHLDIAKLQEQIVEKMHLIPEIAPRYRVTYFNHIVGGYAAGYYGYLWTNVLDADAYEAFKENGIFDKKTADAFRTNVLEKGGSDEPMKLYIQFRGQEPKMDAMLESRGLKN
jgi:peptidyl-dipeptidase Dcp